MEAPRPATPRPCPSISSTRTDSRTGIENSQRSSEGMQSLPSVSTTAETVVAPDSANVCVKRKTCDWPAASVASAASSPRRFVPFSFRLYVLPPAVNVTSLGVTGSPPALRTVTSNVTLLPRPTTSVIGRIDVTARLQMSFGISSVRQTTCGAICNVEKLREIAAQRSLPSSSRCQPSAWPSPKTTTCLTGL